jgi:hypothetical protein
VPTPEFSYPVRTDSDALKEYVNVPSVDGRENPNGGGVVVGGACASAIDPSANIITGATR